MSKLVIIDDDLMEHFVVKHLLKEDTKFNQVTYVLDGSLVIDFIAEHKHNPEILPDVIFLDLNQPRLSSWDFLEDMHKLQPHLEKNIDVYLLSPLIHQDDIDRSTRYSFVKCLINKPLNKEILGRIKLAA